RSGMIELQAGELKATPMPSAAATARRTHGLTPPSQATALRRGATPSIQLWATSRIRRRSSTSASAPAGSERKKIGTALTVAMTESNNGELDNVLIVHTAAVSFIAEPMLELRLASQIARKMGRRRGVHGEMAMAGVALMAEDLPVAARSAHPANSAPRPKGPELQRQARKARRVADLVW